jgi:ubiquitin-like protein 4
MVTFDLLASIPLVFKSLKPPATFTISVRLTDTISAIKAQLASEPSAPSADAQRLLFRGKALADGKLLKEYSNIKDGDTVNLMVKPGYNWNITATTTITPPPVSMPTLSPDSLSTTLSSKSFGSGTLDPEAHSRPESKRHQRIPSVMLSPSPSLESSGAEKDILLTIDAGALPSPILQSDTMSTYHQTVSQPVFWERLHAFLKYVLPPFFCKSHGGLIKTCFPRPFFSQE